MREQVCIILNERESLKHKLVASILEQLKNLSITASRIEVTEKIVEIATLRSPQILVLDYLLGDYSTGLDIVYSINKLPAEKRPVMYFLTDEPSVQVAVEAMQLGVKNYFQIDRNDSVPKLLEEIQSSLSKNRVIKSPPAAKNHCQLDSLICQSESFRNTIQLATSYIKKGVSSIVVTGEPGCGMSSMANAIHKKMFESNLVRELNLSFFDGNIAFITAYPVRASNLDISSKNVSYTIENAECDNGEILQHFSDYLKSGPGKQKQNLTVICTSDRKTAINWKKTCSSEILEIAPLRDRKEDIPPLIQTFQHQAEIITDKKIRKISADNINKISELQWKGNISELKSVFITSCINSLESEEDFMTILSRNKHYWEKLKSEESHPEIEKFHAAKTLESTGHNFRIAAAKLGCSIAELQGILHNSTQDKA